MAHCEGLQLCHLMTPKCVGRKALPIIFENVLKYEKKSEKIKNVKNRHCLRPKKPFQGSKFCLLYSTAQNVIFESLSKRSPLLLLLLVDVDWLSFDGRQRAQNNFVETQMNVHPIVVNVIFTV